MTRKEITNLEMKYITELFVKEMEKKGFKVTNSENENETIFVEMKK